MPNNKRALQQAKKKNWTTSTRGYVTKQDYLGPISEQAFDPFAVPHHLIFFNGKDVVCSEEKFPVFTIRGAAKLLNIPLKTFYKHIAFGYVPRPLWSIKAKYTIPKDRFYYRFLQAYTSKELVIIARTLLVLKLNSCYLSKRNIASRVELELMFSELSEARKSIRKEASWNV